MELGGGRVLSFGLVSGDQFEALHQFFLVLAAGTEVDHIEVLPLSKLSTKIEHTGGFPKMRMTPLL